MKYEAIGEVRYEDPDGGDWEGAQRRLQQEAAELGGDAVVVQAHERYPMGSQWTFGGGTDVSVTGSGEHQTVDVTHHPSTVVPVPGREVRGVVIKYVGTPYTRPVEHHEKFCPIGGERHPASASFCPTHGAVLKPLE